VGEAEAVNALDLATFPINWTPQTALSDTRGHRPDAPASCSKIARANIMCGGLCSAAMRMPAL